MRNAIAGLFFCLTLLAAGCSMLPTEQPPAAESESAPSASTAGEQPGTASRRPRPLRPMKVRPLEVRADCKSKDETGSSVSALLNVSYADVRAFEATVDIPRRGTCRFRLQDFRQVRKEPHVELAETSGCTVRMWEQGSQVTVAFSDCASHCTGNAADYLWPILVDRNSGRCE